MLREGAAFGPRYRILRVLGKGGMGVVYKAWDDDLGIAVALKIIRPEVMADPIAGAELERRFKRELLLARQVTDPHVVRIHDLGHVEGVKYLTMSYIEGRTLAAKLRADGKLPVPEALKIMRQVAAGLAAAHSVGVVHRDLKPDNVMLDAEGHAIIMDFGISRSSSTDVAMPAPRGGPVEWNDTLDTATAAPGMTEAGAVIGTLEYMAPEQARGEPVDPRADIYAFGLILRDIVLGNIRMAGTTALSELRTRMQAPPPAPRTVDPAISAPVDAIIRRCIEPEAAKRFQSTAELIDALNRLDEAGQLLPEPRRFGRKHAAAAFVLVSLLVGATWWLARTPTPPPQPDPTSVLITDFDISGAEGLQGTVEQALTIAMEGAPFVTVFPRRDALALATRLGAGGDGRINVETGRLISQREGIKLMLGGAVSPASGGFDLRVRVIDPANGNVMSERGRTVGSREEILGAIALVAEDVRDGLGDTTPESVRQAQRETFTAASLEASREYSLAQDLAATYKDDEALEHYKRAIELDPNFGRAYAGSAHSASRLGRREEADQLWKKALSMIDRMTNREKYRTLGLYYGIVARNYEQAIDNYATLVKLYPADGAGHNNLALAYFSTRNFSQALVEGRRALEIYPRKLLYRGNYALYAMYATDFTAAREEAERIIKDEPTFFMAYLPLAVAALAQSDAGMARDAYKQMGATGIPGASLAAMGLADVAMYEGNLEEAVRILQEGIEVDERTTNQGLGAAKYVVLAEAFRQLQDRPRAMAAVQKAREEGPQEEIVVPAAAIYLWAGQSAEAEKISQALQAQFEPHRRAYGKLVEGQIAVRERRTIDAIEAFRAGLKLSDLWLLRLNLGILNVEAGRHAEALSDLELCQKRLGEAAAVFLDDVPSFRYVAPLPYWLARAQEGLGMNEPAAANYKAYLALRKNAAKDPLVLDAIRRTGSR